MARKCSNSVDSVAPGARAPLARGRGIVHLPRGLPTPQSLVKTGGVCPSSATGVPRLRGQGGVSSLDAQTGFPIPPRRRWFPSIASDDVDAHARVRGIQPRQRRGLTNASSATQDYRPASTNSLHRNRRGCVGANSTRTQGVYSPFYIGTEGGG